jgi:DNA-binding HxlR family transcriptional regulator
MSSAYDSEDQLFNDMKNVAELIGDKWSIVILFNLSKGPLRFGECLELGRGISSRTLTQRLISLEEKELITKKLYNEYPPRTVYALTEKGEDLWPLFTAMFDWGKKYL